MNKDRLGRWYVQSITGWYQGQGSVVEGDMLNPFRSSVTGETEAAFVAQLQAAAKN